MSYDENIGFSRGRKKFKTPEDLEKAWEEYKNHCDNNYETVHEFSQRNGEFISADLRKKITYTIVGFCNYHRFTRAAFYANYKDDPRYKHIVDVMLEECEVDARSKFETGVIPHYLAPLWMSRYGYSTKNDTNIQGALPIVIENDLND